ncbi:GntR family transcriptional regulator [Labedella populi]|nr:GntR family transcriptional regulator [Labedella populi]
MWVSLQAVGSGARPAESRCRLNIFIGTALEKDGHVLYRQVYDALRARIVDGRYAVGDKLPSEAELSEEYSVSAITVKRALDLLRTDGFIVRRPRLGTFVTSATPNGTTPTEPAPRTRPLIGCVVTNFDDTFGSRVVEGLLSGAGVDDPVILMRSMGDHDLEDASIRSLIDSGVSGLVLQPSSSEFIPPAALELVTRRFPLVILDRVFDGIPVSAVRSDNLAGAMSATEHLLTLGHRSVGFLSAASHVSSSEERRNGWVHAHAAFHRPLDDTAELRTLDSTIPGSTTSAEDDIQRIVAFVREHPHVTAYLAAEYNIALLLREACRRLGLSIPDDVSVVCFDHPDAAFDASLFRFTHVRQQQSAIGERAIDAVRAQIAAPGSIEKVLLPTELVLGASTAPPRA